MINPKWLESIPDDIVALWEEAEDAVLNDAARMIKKYGVTATTQRELQRLRASGNVQKDINKALSKKLGATEKSVAKMMLDAGNAVVQGDSQLYKAAAIYKTTAVDKAALNNVLRQGTQSTLQNLRNIIKATAQNGSKQVYDAIDKAQLLVSSGLYSQEQAVAEAIKTLADHGLDSVTYTDGKGNVTQVASIETAVRRAVQTGVNQTSLKICEELADEVGCDLVEVSAHEGARPSHALWQGKIYSRSGKSNKYPKLSTATGYGTITGLGGVNCRHTFGPWVEGSNTVWSDKELQELQKPSIQYNGKMYTEYDATQLQRKYERTIRKWKRQKAMREAAGLDTVKADAKISEWEAKQADFIDQTGLRRDYAREQIYLSNQTLKPGAEKAVTSMLQKEAASSIPVTVTASDFVTLDLTEDEVAKLNNYLARMNHEDAQKYKELITSTPSSMGYKSAYYSDSKSITYHRDTFNGETYEMSEHTMCHECGHWYSDNTTIDFEYETQKRGRPLRDENGDAIWDENGRMVREPDTIITHQQTVSINGYMSWFYSDEMRASDFDNASKLFKLKTDEEMDALSTRRKITHLSKVQNRVEQFMIEVAGGNEDDPDIAHISDLCSAICRGQYVGEITYGGHSQDYWNSDASQMNKEVYTGYMILRALGRDDIIAGEKKIAPGLMSIIEEAYEKTWKVT